MTTVPGAFPDQVREQAILAHLSGCAGCAAPSPDVHHRSPRRAGGTRAPGAAELPNALPLCRPCHEWAHTNPLNAAAMGWLLPEPGPDVPYWTVALSWCDWISDAGTWLIRPFRYPPSAEAAAAAIAYQRARPRHGT